MTNSSDINTTVATINGNEVVMTKSGNQYTADFSEYELGSLGDGNTTDVNITFFTSDRLSKTVSISWIIKLQQDLH
jgi:VCBS repeat-containing protein